MSANLYRCCAGVITFLILGRPVLGEALTRAQVAKAGKAATVLVKGKLRGAQGSAFCIHPSGIFLTNEHVVGQETGLTLVLHPGSIKAKVFSAKVLRADKGLDLALLQIEGGKEVPVVPLAAGDKLTETDEVIAFGFPFGQVLAPNPKDYPAISVNVGKVTSLREKNGELHRIQLDAVLNPGNSGGPLLDKEGKVVGVVVSGVSGAGVNFAIPMSHVARFIARPEIMFDPPLLKLADIHGETEFQARTLTLVPSRHKLSLELVLKSDNQARRQFDMKLSGALYRVSAMPVPRPKGPPHLRLTAIYPQGSISGQVEDRSFKMGGEKIKFSEIRRLVVTPKPRVWFRAGKMRRGDLSGLEDIPVRLGSAQVILDLAKAAEVRLEPPAGLESLTATVIARRQGKEVGRLTRFLTVQGIPQAGEEEPFLDIDVPTLEKNKVIRKLVAPVADVVVGGGGRYLVLHMPKIRKLAVFDVNEAKVVKLLPAKDDSLKFTAGLDKLVVALPGSRSIERWSLKTFERELSVHYPDKKDIVALTMGSASQGPIRVLATEANSPWPTLYALTLDKLAAREVIWVKTQGFTGQTLHVRSSPDGKSMGVWSTNQSPTGMTWFQWDHLVAKSTYSHSSNGYVLPGPGGKLLFTGLGLFTSIGVINVNKTYPGTDAAGRYLPAQHSDYYMYLGTGPTPQNRNPTPVFAIHKVGVEKPLLRLSDVEVPATDEQVLKHDFTLDKRFHLIPQAKLLIVIPPSNDRLELHRVDVEDAFEKLTQKKK
jgi:hypothetical protein